MLAVSLNGCRILLGVLLPGTPGSKPGKRQQIRAESRYTVGLAPSLAKQVAQYARMADTSISKAIAAWSISVSKARSCESGSSLES